jgi:hypothetical protein
MLQNVCLRSILHSCIFFTSKLLKISFEGGLNWTSLPVNVIGVSLIVNVIGLSFVSFVYTMAGFSDFHHISTDLLLCTCIL